VEFTREPGATSEVKSAVDLRSSMKLANSKRRLFMTQNIIPKGNYFLVGLGIGSLIGVLFAPKSGEETREYLAKKAREGNELARKKAREMRDRVEETVDRGKEIITQTEGRIDTAIDVGIETYNREKAKTQFS
jgi:gas vesicle protein